MLNALSTNKITGITHPQLVTTGNVSKWPKHSEHESDGAGSKTKILIKYHTKDATGRAGSSGFLSSQDFLSCQPNKNICKANSQN